MYDTKVSLVLPQESVEWIDAIAEREERSRSWVIRMAIKRLIEEEEEGAADEGASS